VEIFCAMKTFCCYSCNSISSVFTPDFLFRVDQSSYKMPDFYETTEQKVFTNIILFLSLCVFM